MLNINSALKKLISFLLVINACTLLIPNKFKAIAIGLLGLVVILYYIKNRLSVYNYRYFFTNCILFLIFVASCIYSQDGSYSMKKLETTSSLIIFPFIFSLLLSTNYIVSKKTLRRIFLCFCLSIIVFLILSFCYFWNQEFTFSETIVHYSNLIDIRLGSFSIHPIYLSIYIGVAIMFSLWLFDSNKKTALLICVFSVLCLVFLAILGRRGPVISLILIGVLYFFFKYNVYKILISLFLLLLFFIIMINIPKYQNHNRFDDLYNSSLVKDTSSSVYLRYNIYKCGFETIKGSPLIGYGLGDVQKKLNDCYEANEMKFPNKTYNSHNQFIGIVLIAGFLGLFIYLYSIFLNISKCLKSNSIVTLCLIIYMLFNFLTENILEREDGVILYSFFTCLLLFIIEKRDSKSEDYFSDSISL